MHFSNRLPKLLPNRYSVARARQERDGRPLLDLTVSNPTSVGLNHPDRLLADALASVDLSHYRPDPLGCSLARTTLVERELVHSAERTMLLSCSSEAYSALFRLLCDPGDRVLLPRPSYPLLEHLARLDGLEVADYQLHDAGQWHIDLDQIVELTSGRTRALVLVSPNNPTGSFVSAGEWQQLIAHCAAYDIALICDQVFGCYPLDAAGCAPPEQSDALLFLIDGLSKRAALPQVKLSWIEARGPHRLVEQAMERLSLIGDTFLAASPWVQQALAQLLTAGDQLRPRIVQRLRTNLALATERVAEQPIVDLRRPEAGWALVLRIPATSDEEQVALDLLAEGVAIHPGYFFDFARSGYLVVSLLAEPEQFANGLAMLLAADALRDRT